MSIEALREKLAFAEKNPAIFETVPVLDKGFVRLVDWMGNDSRVVQAARVSYGEGTKTVREDAGLIDYLVRNRHCYHPEMEVLTVNGWKRWSDCGDEEDFLVPDPHTRQYRREKLVVKSWDVEEDLYTFQNNRMSYKVTSGHKMWFKGKYQDEFSKVKVEEMKKWGHFDPTLGYRLSYNGTDVPWELLDTNPQAEFSGFFMGDGSFSSINTVTFRLKKKRKVTYLLNLLSELDITPNVHRETEDGVTVITLQRPEFLSYYVVPPTSRPDSNRLDKPLVRGLAPSLDARGVKGLWVGLVNSDGHVKKDRPQISYSSWSDEFLHLFETLGVIMGYDVHGSLHNSKVAYQQGNTTLESRSQYHGKESYKGKVYCATTSTGLLAVRGSPDGYGFICGNTSPLEMVVFTFHIKLPLFVFGQLVRHRMASLNAMSARYSVMKDEFYIPDVVRTQSTTNKQGSDGGTEDEINEVARRMISRVSADGYEDYEYLLGMGVAREQARMVLSQNLYTEVYWKQDLHNLFHLLKLRMDSHAQKEIQDYANALFGLIQPLVPNAVTSWTRHTLDSTTLSSTEVSILRDVFGGKNYQEAFTSYTSHLSPRYAVEIKAKLDRILGAD
jgi:thymidylate synthase (FAD)